MIRVLVSDGINNTAAEATGLTLEPNHAPSIDIVSPQECDEFKASGGIILNANVYDLEDGSLPDESIEWASDIDGVLGHGAFLNLELSAGTHTLTLTATDSDDLESSATVVVIVN